MSFALHPPGDLESLKAVEKHREEWEHQSMGQRPHAQGRFPLLSNFFSPRATHVVFHTSLLPHHMLYSQQAKAHEW